MTGPFFILFIYLFIFKQYTCRRSAYKLAFQVLGKAMGWPRSQECLALCWVGFSQGEEMSFGCREHRSPAERSRHLFASKLVLPVARCWERVALTCHLSRELRPSERASASSLNLADGLFHFCDGDCNEAAAE